MALDVKEALKIARNYLREHRYVDAMKQCQMVLMKNKNDYMAIVMLAAALKEIEEYKSQAPLALKRAIAIDPTKPLAWQGIVAFYENEPDNATAWTWLCPAYRQLLEHDTRSSKFCHYIVEVSRLSIRLKDEKVVEAVVETLSKLRDDCKDERKKTLDRALIDIFGKFPVVAKTHRELYMQLLFCIVRDESYEERQDCFKKYIKLLYGLGKVESLLGNCILMHQHFPKDPYPLEWICHVYTEEAVSTCIWEGIEIQQVYEALFVLDETSCLATFARGVQLWLENNLIEARDVLNQAILQNENLKYAWLVLGEINVKLYCWSEAENAAQRASLFISTYNDADDDPKKISLRKRIDHVLVEAMTRSGNAEKMSRAVLGCEELLSQEDDDRIKLLLARIYVMQEENLKAEELLCELETKPETRIEATIIRALASRNKRNYDEAADILGSALETSEAWTMLGELNWNLGEYRHSLMAFLKGIHADPNNWQCLLYLGNYYRERGNDLEKSCKCYRKALRINPNSDEAGVGLSTAFRLMKNTEANMQMLLRVTTAEGGGPKWAWLQLGLQQLDQGEVGNAIKSLRYVIRADPNDNHCWESLADAYLTRGAHTSALKSYQRALELSPGSLYPMIQLANIKVVLGQHVEAKEDFGKVLSQEPRYLPALKGLAETCLGLSREHARQQLLGRSRRNAQQAVDSLTDAIVENSELSCVWKLLGDACYRVAVFPEKYCYLEITPGLVKSDSKEERITVRKSELFVLAARCFCRALSLSKDSPFLWHDIACCYLSQLKLDPTVNRREAAMKCLAAAKQAVTLCPSTWVHWNILAVVCMTDEVKNYALAQHCCVMAIDREPNNAIAWTNLGTLYLSLGDPYKANAAFSRAQRADPEYMNCWIGQGLIAEAMCRKEAMDLFMRAISLGYHHQAAIGYGHWALTTLLDPEAKKDPRYTYMIENMHAVAVATDAMTWYIERVPNDSCGRNAYGLLLERQKLYKPASREFAEALKHEKDESKKDKVRINLSRVLVQLGDYDNAIETCKEIQTASFKSHCQLALALFKANRFEESYAAYEATLNCLADAGSDKAHVLCAMAAMAYMFQEVDDVKTLLFQCIQIQPSTVAGLLAAAALGLLHDDTNLTNLVLHELQPYKDDPDHRHHVAVLTSHACLVHHDVEGAIRVLSKAVHRHPDDVGCWVALVKILLRCNSRKFANCAQKALLFGRKTSAVSVSRVACISSLGDLSGDVNADSTRRTPDYQTNETKNIYDNRGFRSVQKTILSFPANVESWANLVVALSSRSETTNSRLGAAWVAQLISIIRKQLETTKQMDEWLKNNEREATRLASDIRSRGNDYTNVTLAA